MVSLLISRCMPSRWLASTGLSQGMPCSWLHTDWSHEIQQLTGSLITVMQLASNRLIACHAVDWQRLNWQPCRVCYAIDWQQTALQHVMYLTGNRLSHDMLCTWLAIDCLMTCYVHGWQQTVSWHVMYLTGNRLSHDKLFTWLATYCLMLLCT